MKKLVIKNFHITFANKAKARKFVDKLDELCYSSINPLKQEFSYELKIAPDYEAMVSSFPGDHK